MDAPDDRIGDHGDGDGGDYVDAPDDHIGDHGDDIGDDGNDGDYVDQPLTLSAFLRTASTLTKRMSLYLRIFLKNSWLD